jgi:predicted DNA-binding transcriptional regulator YafY
MRRADRLFQLVERLRRRRRAQTGSELAEALGVSLRTVYRDVQDLVASGVPIRGEAGVGYALDASFDLPPIMFDEEEIEALMLGARMVEAAADPALARAAQGVVAKVRAVLPKRLEDQIESSPLYAPRFHLNARGRAGLEELRGAIRDRRKVALEYQDREGASTVREVEPLGLYYWGTHGWSLGAWCALRSGFRNFRLDRIHAMKVLDAPCSTDPARSLAALLRHDEEETEGAAPRRDR